MFRKTVLESGVRIVTEQLDFLRSVSVGIWVNAGSRDETRAENGISHFIEHMIFKGTKSRTSLQIAKELDAIGGLSNAFTGKENTCFHARVLGKHFEVSADILSDIFLNSNFDLRDMERERQVILQEISMVEDTPDENIHVLFHGLIWNDHPMGMSTLGTQETVAALKKDNILDYVSQCYVPERIIVAAGGNVDHASVVNHFGPFFEPLEGGHPKLERRAPQVNTGVSVHFKDLEQVHICLGGEAPGQASNGRFACAILNTILGGNMSSRLFQEIRENRGLAYAVYSFLSTYLDAGLLGVYVATDFQNVHPVIETIGREIKKLSKGAVSEKDLDAAKDHLIGGIYLASENADNRMIRLAKNEFVFGREVGYEEVVSNLEQVTVDDVIEMANTIFADGRVSLVTLGPLKEEDLDKSCLEFG